MSTLHLVSELNISAAELLFRQGHVGGINTEAASPWEYLEGGDRKAMTIQEDDRVQHR